MAYKKDDIPRVKIPKFATGGICNDAILPKIDMFSEIDEIVKDIRDRQDNAMSMEFTKCIGELLRKNGVVPKITEYTRNFETDKTFETRYGVSIDELDFSEHDKVFKDEIAVLKKRIAELENNETEKPTKINLNDLIKVKLTPLGAEIYYHQYDELNKRIKENGGTQLEPTMPWIDKDGYTEFQLHCFMNLYGEHIRVCKPNVIEPLDIIICE